MVPEYQDEDSPRPFKLAIVGSRKYPDLFMVQVEIDWHAAENDFVPLVIVSGGADGVDDAAESYAETLGLDRVSIRPKKVGPHSFVIERYENGEMVNVYEYAYNTFGQAAYARNRIIVDEADKVVVLWDGKSPGTKNTIDIAVAVGKHMEVLPRPTVGKYAPASRNGGFTKGERDG